jgi:hypothetical protein
MVQASISRMRGLGLYCPQAESSPAHKQVPRQEHAGLTQTVGPHDGKPINMFELLPSDRDERWRLLETFIAEWFRPLTSADRVSSSSLEQAERRLGRDLPLTLREWYQLTGNFDQLWSAQDKWLKPQDLYLTDEALVFFIENQGAFEWGIQLQDLLHPDPPVNIFNLGASPLQENDTLSEFALQMALYAVKFSNQPSIDAALDPLTYSRVSSWLQQSMQPCQFPTWHCFGEKMSFYESNDIIVELKEQQAGWSWIWATAKTQKASRYLSQKFAELGLHPESR